PAARSLEQPHAAPPDSIRRPVRAAAINDDDLHPAAQLGHGVERGLDAAGLVQRGDDHRECRRAVHHRPTFHNRTQQTESLDSRRLPSGAKPTPSTAWTWPSSASSSSPVRTSQTFTSRSAKPAEAALLPSGDRAASWMVEPCRIRLSSLPDFTSRTHKVPSDVAENASLPPGRKTTLPTGLLCPLNDRSRTPVFTSKSNSSGSIGVLAVPTSSSSPSGENARERGEPRKCGSRRRSLPVLTSHRRTVLSTEAEAASAPSGDSSTHTSPRTWPVNVCTVLSEGTS